MEWPIVLLVLEEGPQVLSCALVCSLSMFGMMAGAAAGGGIVWAFSLQIGSRAATHEHTVSRFDQYLRDRRTAARRGRLLIISPHLDDAVFSCANLLLENPGAVVVTVFAGIPAKRNDVPDWDRSCGFTSTRQAMLARRREDRLALRLLGAEPHWLGFLDFQYREQASPGEIPLALLHVLQRYRPARVAVPLGLHHLDHRVTHVAALHVMHVMHEIRGIQWLLYEDAIYGSVPGLVEERLASLPQEDGITLHLAKGPGRADAPLKAKAVQCYPSQLRGLAASGWLGKSDLLGRGRPERYWDCNLAFS